MRKKASLFLLVLFFLTSVSWAQSFDLIAEAKRARWFNDQGQALPFPGNPTDSRGFARVLSLQMEDGRTYPSALQTHPRWVSNGWVEGRYQVFIPEEALFEATVGFKDGARGSDGVIFEVIWRQGGNDILLTLTPQAKTELIYTFSPVRGEIPPLPAQALKAQGPEILLPMLFLRLKFIAGWIEPNHCQFAQKSIDLIEQNDKDKRYAEIYSSKWGDRYEYIRKEEGEFISRRKSS
ncbi:MAG: hypothetical protein QHH14_13565 [Clostridiales bacterium]|nr:hypothetical protein [Clostridiales bacterium]